jgi:EpsI family protein
MIFMRKNILLMALMIGASILAILFHPTHKIADKKTKVNLEMMIPKQLGDWQENAQQIAQIISPDQEILVKKLYSQTISRTYKNTNGDMIMLTIAYGDDQSDSKSLHYPEVCYPAQGFQLTPSKVTVLKTKFGDIKAKQLMATLGSRSEPVTYWATVANKVVVSGLEAKFAQLNYSFRGQIPDGLLFRISSISTDSQHAFNIQEAFIRELMASISSSDRATLAGLSR